MSEVIRAAAKKWFYESFDCDLLEKMEKAGLIAQAEGFSISVMADLELDMKAAFDRVTAERDAALETLKASREIGVSDQQTIQNLVSERDALQQRLTAADARADVLERFLRQFQEVAHGGFLDDDHVRRVRRDIDAALKPAACGRDEPNCLICLDKKTVPSNLAEGYVMDCPDCCGEEG